MDACNGIRQASTSDGSIHFRLVADCAAVRADVRLRNAGDRWVADSNSSGQQATGIGSTPRAAIVASLESLGSATVAELLADLRLLDVSCQLREVSAR